MSPSRSVPPHPQRLAERDVLVGRLERAAERVRHGVGDRACGAPAADRLARRRRRRPRCPALRARSGCASRGREGDGRRPPAAPSSCRHRSRRRGRSAATPSGSPRSARALAPGRRRSGRRARSPRTASAPCRARATRRCSTAQLRDDASLERFQVLVERKVEALDPALAPELAARARASAWPIAHDR